MESSFYRDPNFYIAITAVLALIVSLIPYVSAAWSGRKIKITLPSQILIDHYLGLHRLTMFIDIANAGAIGVTVSKIDCVLEKIGSDKRFWHMPAQTYFFRQGAGQASQAWPEFLIGPITLKAGDHWQEFVRCYENVPEEWDEETQSIRVSLAKNIEAKILERQKQGLPHMLQEADISVVDRACEQFRKTFRLSKGEYLLYVVALDESGKPLASQGFKFILFENSIQALQEIVQRYKYGFGVVWPVPGETTVWPQPRLNPALDPRDALQRYRTLLAKV